jgi:hypothetical protein
MRKIKLFILSVLTFSFFSLTSIQAKGDEKSEIKPTMTEAEIQVLVDRLEVIKTMDRSNMERSERKELRSEVREIKEEIKRNSGGVYLSIGALLLVIILLVLLL